jgi:hypothetical protein
MSTIVTVGIDPGAKGAIALKYKGNLTLYPLRHDNALEELQSIKALSVSEGWRVRVWMEEIPKHGGVNASSIIKLALSAGRVQGIVEAIGMPLRLIRPQEWQHGLTGVAKLKGPARKRALLAEAKRRHPSLKLTLETADAALIADYGEQRA